tara:strand:- start:103 stop:516 length:414 start_codon:yes stop_codon:yes gene_type:complete
MILDATEVILGRLASFAASQALLGKKVDIINSEKAVITGRKKYTLQAYLEKVHRGSSTRGPFMRRSPDRFVKRAIRGMLPYNSFHGKKAFSRIRCYQGVPEEFTGKDTVALKGMDTSKLAVAKYVTVKEVCTTMGGK